MNWNRSLQDLQGEIDKVCKFLGKTLSEEQRGRLLSHLKFDNFSKNPAVNGELEIALRQKGPFIRNGINHPLPTVSLLFPLFLGIGSLF